MGMYPGPYYVGASLTLDVDFMDDTCAPVDPVAVRLRLRNPDGTEAVYEYNGVDGVSRASVGFYIKTLTPTMGGRHFFRWETTSPDTAREGNFIVQRSPHHDHSTGAYW